MKEFFSYFKGYYKQAVLGPLCKLFEAVLELFIPILTAHIINKGIPSGDVGEIIKYGLLMFGLGFLGLLAAITCQYFASSTAQGFGLQLRTKLFDHVLSLSPLDIGDQGADSLITRLTNDVNQIQTGVNMSIRLATRTPFLSIGAIIMAYIINPVMGGIFLAATLLIVLALWLVMSKSVVYYKDIQKKQDYISGCVGENLEGIRVIRAFSRQEDEIAGFKNAGNALAKITVFAGKISGFLNPLTYAIVNMTVIVILWQGAHFANAGTLAAGDLIALINYMNSSLIALMAMVNLIILFTRAVASWGRVKEVLDLQPSILDGEARTGDAKGKGSLEFKGVSFAYHEGGEPAVESIDFKVNGGETLGIIGGTGCGKSTLVKLLMRYYDVSNGAILVDGVNIKDYSLSALRKKMGYVAQTALLFNGTIRSNLQMGQPKATDEEMLKALDIAQGLEFVEKKAGKLDAVIEESGKNLSGGQKQRLTIARALVRSPEILILDDSASALDYATDAKLRRALKEKTNQMTVVMISQRAATVKNADKILVMDDGQIAGFGTHDTLLKTCKVYHEICASQKLIQEGTVA